jgi:hypothetical protein
MRKALILCGLVFGTWEAVDIFWIDVPEFAALFSVLFLACTAWFWRRRSVKPVVVMAVLFGFEAAVAPSLQHVMTITKVAAFTLGVLGLASAVAVLALRRSAAATRARPGRRARTA